MKIFHIVMTFVFMLLGTLKVHAYTPFFVNQDGAVITWNNTVTLHPEAGDCRSITHAEMMTILEDPDNGLAQWGNVDIDGGSAVDVDLTINVVDGEIPVDVTAANYLDYYAVST